MLRSALAALALSLLGAAAVAPPAAPVFSEPVLGAHVNPADVHMEVVGYSDPDGQAHATSDWEITRGGVVVWQAPGVDDLERVHIHLADGAFVGPYAGRTEMEPDTDYVVRCRFRDVAGETSAWSERPFHTSPAGPPGVPGPNPWVPAAGFAVEVVAGGFQLPTNIAFVPNPGPNPTDPFFYVTELYGTVKVVLRNGSVSNFATGLINFNPTGAFPGSGEQGSTGLCVDPATGHVFVATLWEHAGGPHYPRVIRFASADGGRTASTSTVILDFVGEPQGQSHQISNLTIGPDGKLYVHNGDGFDTSTALNLDSYRGKILRSNLDGSAPTDNPFYDAANGINARDYVYAYGLRNPFGGAWRADGVHYQVENGPSVDRLAKVSPGQNFGWNGTDASMSIGAAYVWNPSHAPVNAAFGGGGFPADRMDRLYVTESGPTYAAGPQARGKRVVEFQLDAAGAVTAGPATVVEYNGTGRATAVALASGPDGLYFSELYKDQDAATPVDAGARVLRLRWVGTHGGGEGGDGLRAEYFNNADFTAPALTRVDSTVNFDWGNGAPDPAVGADSFSVRWTGQVDSHNTETVTFHTVSDDGVRLWVNDVLLIDNWTDHGPTENTGAIPMTAGQKVNIKMEMYENGGGAVAQLFWSSPSFARQVIPQHHLFSGPTGGGAGTGLTGVYHDTLDFTGTSITRTDATVDFVWGGGAPHAAIAADTFSVRWTGQVEAPASETFTFYTQTDDGVRLWVNNVLLVDKWIDQGTTEWSGAIALTAGVKVDVRMDYFENGGDATARLLWSSPSVAKQVIPTARLFPPGSGGVVPAPAITPNGGTFTSSVQVSLASDDGAASIRYTTDGATPTSSVGTLYTAPFTLTSSATVKAIATKAGAQDSAVASAVFTIVPPGGGTGLTGEYYDNMDLTNLVLTRVDAVVDFDWGTGSPAAGVGVDTFSVRWTGEIDAPAAATYTFYTMSDDGIRLWVNNTLVVDNWTDHPPTENSGTIALAAGRVPIRIEFYENAVGAVATLSWSSPTIAKQIVPQTRLFPTSTPAVATPTITPNGGGFAGPVSVTLSTSTAGASLFYSTDGSAPSVPYAGPFTVSISSTVRAIATKAGMSDSAIASAAFTITTSGGTGLTGQYFDNADFTALTVTRADATVDFDWGVGAPAPGVGPDGFSVRWTGQVEAPETATMTFYTVSDDGIRLWVNNVLLINNWTDHGPTENAGTLALAAGQKYDVVMEMYENGGGAVARLLWSGPSTAKAVIPQARLFPAAPTGLTGTYFDNIDLTAPVLARTDATIDFDWGGGSPDPAIGPDTFSVRWTGRVKPRYSETYTFYTVSDDGVRLWVNGVQVINNWTDHPPTENAGTIALAADQLYDITMELFENGGGATARLSWSSPSQAKEVVPASRLFPPAGGAGKSVAPLVTIGGAGFDTLQDAVAAAVPGDVIELGPVTCIGGLALPAGVSLRGTSARVTVLDGDVTATGPSTIEHVRITGAVDALAGDVALRHVIAEKGVLGRQGARVDAVHVTIPDGGARLLGGGSLRNSIVLGPVSGATVTYTSFERDFDAGFAETGAAIDAGDPADFFSLEPAPNGGRANLGAFGDTPDAATSEVAAKGAPAEAVTFPDSGDPMCGALGLEALLALLLAARRKRAP